MAKLVAEQFIHSCHVTNLGHDKHDALVVKQYNHYDDGSVVPKLIPIIKPRRSFYITKKGMQELYNESKEWEDMCNLDKYDCYNYEMPYEIHKALHGYYPRQKPQLRKLFDSPYVYGADICIDALVAAKKKQAFMASGVVPARIKTGFWDTESDMKNGPTFGDTIMASITHENKLYTGVLKRFLFHIDPKTNTRVMGTVEDLIAISHQALAPYIEKYGIEIEIRAFDTSVELHRWIWSTAHANKTDTIGVWNAQHDMNVIQEDCEKAEVDVKDILCDPDLPKDLRYFRYAIDTSTNVPHFTRYWDVSHLTAHFQIYDAMQLYSRLRIVKGFEGSYKLNHILESNIGIGKMKFPHLKTSDDMSETDWHRYMQENHPYYYAVYNQFDVLGLQIQEWKIQDANGLITLAGITPIKNFSKQTRKAADDLHFACLALGKVIGTTGSSNGGAYDHLIPKAGGAVLPTENTFNVGINVINGLRHVSTLVSTLVNDIDLAAMYPNTGIAANVSRETKTSTLLQVEGFTAVQSQMLTSMLSSIEENAVPIATTFFDLPGYLDMETLYEQSR